MEKPQQNESVVPIEWFPRPLGGEGGLMGGAWCLTMGFALAGLLLAAVLHVRGATIGAAVVFGLSLVIGTAAVVSTPARLRLNHWFLNGVRAVVRLVAVLFWTPVFLVGLGWIRLWGGLLGRDPLGLRAHARSSHWRESPPMHECVRSAAGMFSPCPSEKKGAWTVWCFLILALLIGFELALRSHGYGAPVLYRNDLRTVYRPEPGQELSRSGCSIVTNRLGFRAPDHADEKGPGDARLLVLGGDAVWGGYAVEQSELVVYELERRLRGEALQRGGTGEVEVWSMAAEGWGPLHLLGALERFGYLQADRAVVLLPVSDLARGLSHQALSQFYEGQHPPRLALEEWFANLTWGYHQRRTRLDSAQADTEGVQAGIEACVAIVRRLRERGCEAIFVVLPSADAVATGVMSPGEAAGVKLLRAAMQAEQVTVHFPVEWLHGGSEPQGVVYDARGRLLPWGHARLAEYLAAQWSEGPVSAGAVSEDSANDSDEPRSEP